MCRCVRAISRQLLDICCTMLTSCLCVVIITEGVRGVRLSKLEVREDVIRGESVWLNCSFDMETDELYSIKWFKNNLEFYRYLPSDYPPAQKYDLLGIFLDLVKSEFGHVYLYKTDLNSDGRYRCEVSADAPSFQTVRAEKEMRIFVLPDHDPIISGAHTNYRIGDELNMTCTAAFSKPPAILKWYLNGNDVSRAYEVHYPPIVHITSLQSTRLGLRFIVQPIHFWNGIMSLKCVGLLSKVYGKASDEIIASTNAKPSRFHSGKQSEALTITGGKMQYQIGEHVNVNCTAIKSQSPAELHWFINDKKSKSNYVINYPSLRYPDGKESTILGLKFMVRPKHFKHGEMRLKCTAILSKVFNLSSNELVLDSKHQSSGLHALDSNGRILNLHPSVFTILWLLSVGFLINCL